MSQQTGPLSEDEIKNYFNESYGLNLDRDCFEKPNKDIITDIYMRYLDEVLPNWRRSRSSHEELDDAMLKAMLVGRMRFIMSHQYNTFGFEFQITDLLAPTKKRTTAFLNVLVFLRDQYHTVLRYKASIDEQEAQELQRQQGIERELADTRYKIEQMTIQISTARSELERLPLNEKKRELDSLKDEISALLDNIRVVDSKIQAASELEEKLKTCIEQKDCNEKEAFLQTCGDIKRRRTNAEVSLKSEAEALKQFQKRYQEESLVWPA